MAGNVDAEQDGYYYVVTEKLPNLIWGYGRTEKEAIMDAHQVLEGSHENWVSRNENENLVVARVEKPIYDYVDENGGGEDAVAFMNSYNDEHGIDFRNIRKDVEDFVNLYGLFHNHNESVEEVTRDTKKITIRGYEFRVEKIRRYLELDQEGYVKPETDQVLLTVYEDTSCTKYLNVLLIKQNREILVPKDWEYYNIDQHEHLCDIDADEFIDHYNVEVNPDFEYQGDSEEYEEFENKEIDRIFNIFF